MVMSNFTGRCISFEIKLIVILIYPQSKKVTAAQE